MHAKIPSWVGGIAKRYCTDLGSPIEVVIESLVGSQPRMDHPRQRKGYNEQRTFLGLVLVPFVSLPPGLMWHAVLWVGARQV